MATAHSVAELAVHAADLAPLAELSGGVLSVFLELDVDVDDAPRRNELRWRSLRAASAADETILARVDPLIGDAHRRGRGLAVIADAERLRWVEHAATAFAPDVARWSSLPSLVPLLERRQTTLPHLVVRVDRLGADVELRSGTTTFAGEVDAVREEPVHRPHAGGWSEARYQRRAENTWRANAAEVAEALARLADEHTPRLVLVGGDVRAVELLRGSLPERTRGLLREVPGADREPATPDEGFEHEVERLVATVVAEDTVALLHELEQALGRRERAVNGPDETLAALARGQVDVLLVHDDPDDERTARFGPGLLQIADTADALTAGGVDQPQEARLVDVAVRAALGGDAKVRVVPGAGPVAGGVAALLRWS